MRRLAAALALSLTIGFASANAGPQTVIDDSDAPAYLFTMTAESGTYVGDKVTLKGVPLVVYFSDRPHRIAGHMDLEKFLDIWADGVDRFKNDPPNAELAIYDENGDKHPVLVISKPVVDGDNISYEVKVLDETIPDSFGHATLFIDNFRVVGGRL